VKHGGDFGRIEGSDGSVSEVSMETEERQTKEKVTLEEIEELYDRLGITRAAPEAPRSFEEYTWKYGFKPQEKRTRTTLDTRTARAYQTQVRAWHSTRAGSFA